MKTVLVACEFSGTVRNAFAARGWDAWSCDLLPSETPGQHIQGDALDALHSRDWDLVIAHPPCQFLCSSGMHWTRRGFRDPQSTEDAFYFAKAFFDCAPRWCVENSIGVLSTRIRKPDQILQPWQFGHDASKATCLWFGGLPPLTPTGLVPGRKVTLPTGRVAQRWANQTDSGQNRLAPSADRWKLRANTYSGIAKAMAEQWGAI